MLWRNHLQWSHPQNLLQFRNPLAISIEAMKRKHNVLSQEMENTCWKSSPALASYYFMFWSFYISVSAIYRYVYIYIYFSLMSSHWWACLSVLLTPGLPLSGKLFCYWAHFGDRGKCPGQMLAPSTVRSLWNIFRTSLCQQRVGGICRKVEFSWVRRNEKYSFRCPCWYVSQQHRGCLSQFFPKAAQKQSGHLPIHCPLLTISSHIPLLCFHLFPFDPAHGIKTSPTSTICWHSTLPKSCSPGCAPVFYQNSLSSTLLPPTANVWYTEFPQSAAAGPSWQRLHLFGCLQSAAPFTGVEPTVLPSLQQHRAVLSLT